MNDLETRKPGTLGAMARDTSAYSAAALTPAVDVVEDSTGITLHADLPGVSKDKLQIQTEADTLTIEAELDLPVPEGLQSTHTEVALGRFRRTFRLSQELDPSNVTAKLVQGVLILKIPKAEHAQPRRIHVDG
ncbi:Hsp20/alpha crystallin family protein [Variovorax sp. J22R115]|uniref:Hsp20/alpha crystallin family protein n=1 Tax=Variovorax sp. J22R115 TaxID=3053509 RepID=UPI0025765535|nr:Hsp20/alpha crystallin family protein [Variovorax sp. J22R115]MDM0050388.1 Hsp20/alpha crystallin family protein [Variovorax sp. J22R115]